MTPDAIKRMVTAAYEAQAIIAAGASVSLRLVEDMSVHILALADEVRRLSNENDDKQHCIDEQRKTIRGHQDFNDKTQARIRELEAAIRTALERFTPSYGPSDPVNVLAAVVKGEEPMVSELGVAGATLRGTDSACEKLKVRIRELEVEAKLLRHDRDVVLKWFEDAVTIDGLITGIAASQCRITAATLDTGDPK